MKSSWIFLLIGVAVLGWGVFHAVGAYQFNHNLGRPAMVLGCVVAFLGFWGAMLAARRARLRREARPPEPRDIS